MSKSSSSNHAIQVAPKTAPARPAEQSQRSEWSYLPAIDVYEIADAYVIKCDAPGLKSEGIELTYDSGVLRLHGEVPGRHPENATFLRQEYGVGDFDREISLGRLAEFVDGERAEAAYQDGVLTIQLPKLEVVKPRRISVTTTPAN